MKSLMQMLIDAGYPKDKIHHHNSDLYVYVTPLTTKILEDWCITNGWNSELIKKKSFLFSVFKDNITGAKMYDIAFQYLPWWNEKCNVREEVQV